MAARIRPLVWAQSARDALDEVIGYIARDSPQGALKMLETALDTAASLTTFSERGRVVPELNDATIREVFVHRYRLLYQVEDARVVVVAFLHGARDLGTWWRSQAGE